MKHRANGFTLMELLVVLLIIGILSSVALRTIDATRDRGLYEETMKEMRTLAQAMVGNPEIVINGHRTDFGFFGDMRRLPNDLQELVANTTGSPDWRGPYLRREFESDSAGFRYDAWGRPYTYDQSTGTISSLGNGRRPLTLRVVDSLPQLYANSVTGTITDGTGRPPGELNNTITIWLRLPGMPRFTTPDQSGYYYFDSVPIGNHRLVAQRVGGDSIARWVSVAPRSRAVVDFRFSRPFRNYLRMVGEPQLQLPESCGFYIRVVNEGPTDDTVASIQILSADSNYYTTLFTYSGDHGNGYQPLNPGVGKGGTIVLQTPYAVRPDRGEIVVFGFYDFYQSPGGPPSPKQNVSGRTFRLRFNDGSEITVRP
ncbi:MAG: prepilin-type N-terminal cleavage/methylation domain-containing protein [candidate division WOR-3 bacterium]